MKELGIDSCALTDHGNIHGIIDFYKECKKEGIHALLGMETYCTEDPDRAEEKNRDNYHLVLLAKNQAGLKNLIYLSSNAYLNNFYYKPRIHRKLFEDHSEGLIALSACLASHLSRALRYEHSVQKVYLDDKKGLQKLIAWFSEVFKGNYYLEIQDHDAWEQRAYNEFLISFARGEGVPLVITSDAHYIKPEDFSTHELLMAMQFKKTIDEYRTNNQMRYGKTNYIKSHNEMLASAKKYQVEDAYHNTKKIAEECTAEIEFSSPKLPTFPVKDASDYGDFLSWRARRKNK